MRHKLTPVPSLVKKGYCNNECSQYCVKEGGISYCVLDCKNISDINICPLDPRRINKYHRRIKNLGGF